MRLGTPVPANKYYKAVPRELRKIHAFSHLDESSHVARQRQRERERESVCVCVSITRE